jgi:uncharacterized protein YdeI (YjbR/CyaY-like superfamily)
MDPNLPSLEFADANNWRAWLDHNHAEQPSAVVKIAKAGAPRPTLTQVEAIDVALCFGWIDGTIRRIDEHYYCVRFTPRRSKSKWSLRNTRRAEELIEQGQMTAAGQQEVDNAKQDGRWEAAYSMAESTVPPDFQAALDANPQANELFKTLSAQNRFAFLFRIDDAKLPETRAKRIAQFTQMLREGQTFH